MKTKRTNEEVYELANEWEKVESEKKTVSSAFSSCVQKHIEEVAQRTYYIYDFECKNWQMSTSYMYFFKYIIAVYIIHSENKWKFREDLWNIENGM